MDMPKWGMLLFLTALIAALVVWILVCRARDAVRTFSREVLGTSTVIDGLKRQREQLAATPKSVSGMTRVFLPQIERDFPEFSLQEFIQKSENQLRGALGAVEKQNPALAAGASPELKKQLAFWVEDDKRQGIREQFQSIIIHKTAISRYEKSAGCCVITFQSAVEYMYRRWADGQAAGEQAERTQSIYEMEWVYIQDIEKLPDQAKAVAFCCPNCGAPIKILGARVCEYCGSVIEPVNIRVWSLDRIRRQC